jgi:hypothetical protein
MVQRIGERLRKDFLKQSEGDSSKLLIYPSVNSGGATIQARIYPLFLQSILHSNSYQHGDRETEFPSAPAKSLIAEDVVTLTNTFVSH